MILFLIVWDLNFLIWILIYLEYNEREPEDLARFVIDESKKVD